MERWREWGGGLSGEFTVGLKSEKQCDLVLGRGGGFEEGKRADWLRELLTQDSFFLFLRDGEGVF